MSFKLRLSARHARIGWAVGLLVATASTGAGQASHRSPSAHGDIRTLVHLVARDAADIANDDVPSQVTSHAEAHGFAPLDDARAPSLGCLRDWLEMAVQAGTEEEDGRVSPIRHRCGSAGEDVKAKIGKAASNRMPSLHYSVPLATRRGVTTTAMFGGRRGLALGSYNAATQSFPIVPCLRSLVAVGSDPTRLTLNEQEISGCDLRLRDPVLVARIQTAQSGGEAVIVTGRLHLRIDGVRTWRNEPSLHAALLGADLVLNLPGGATVAAALE